MPRWAKFENASGSVIVQSGAQHSDAQPGDLLHESESVYLGSNSQARLTIGDQAVIEIGPSSALKVLQLPAASGVTNLRLERGFLRLVWADPDGSASRLAAISFGKWAARVSSGEFLFEVGPQRARICGLAGEIEFAGTGYDAPKRLSGGCTELADGKPPIPMIPSASDWQLMREQFSIRTGPARAPRAAGQPPALQVEAVSGTVALLRPGITEPLTVGTVFLQGQGVETYSDAGMRASFIGEGTMELGPGSRVTVRKLPVDGTGSATWLRLDKGTMMILWEPYAASSLPLEVSFSRWAVKIDAGEYFFAARTDRATVCRFWGEPVFSGVPATLPRTFTDKCVELTSDQPARPRPIAEVADLRETLGIVKTLRAQLPTPYTVTPTAPATTAPPGADDAPDTPVGPSPSGVP